MSKLNAFIICFCLILASVLFIVIRVLFDDFYKDFLINICAGILTVGFTVFLVDVTRESSRKNKIKQIMPVVCGEVQTSSNNILALITLRIHHGDKDLAEKMLDIRDRFAWNDATAILLNRTVGIKEQGAVYLKNFDMEYMRTLYKAVKLEEKNLVSIYSRYPTGVEDAEFAKIFADLTKSVRQIIWAYEEISDQSKTFLLAYGKDRGLKSGDSSEVIRYHMSFPLQQFVNNYYTFVTQFRDYLGMPKDWSKVTLASQPFP